MACTVLGLGSCTERPRPLEIDNALTAEEIAAGRFTPEVMWKMGRLGAVVSFRPTANGSSTRSDLLQSSAENRGVTALYLVADMAFGQGCAMPDRPHVEQHVAGMVAPTGARSISCRTAAARMQVWRMAAEGGDARRSRVTAPSRAFPTSRASASTSPADAHLVRADGSRPRRREVVRPTSIRTCPSRKRTSTTI